MTTAVRCWEKSRDEMHNVGDSRHRHRRTQCIFKYLEHKRRFLPFHVGKCVRRGFAYSHRRSCSWLRGSDMWDVSAPCVCVCALKLTNDCIWHYYYIYFSTKFQVSCIQRTKLQLQPPTRYKSADEFCVFSVFVYIASHLRECVCVFSSRLCTTKFSRRKSHSDAYSHHK